MSVQSSTWNVYRIADAKIIDNWYLSDSLYLAEQLGMKLIPAETASEQERRIRSAPVTVHP